MCNAAIFLHCVDTYRSHKVGMISIASLQIHSPFQYVSIDIVRNDVRNVCKKMDPDNSPCVQHLAYYSRLLGCRLGEDLCALGAQMRALEGERNTLTTELQVSTRTTVRRAHFAGGVIDSGACTAASNGGAWPQT